MKYLKLFFIAALSMFTICSCTDSNIVPDEPEKPVNPDDPEKPEDPETEADYLIMLYGVGGRDLDKGIIGNVMQTIDEGVEGNIRMTYQFKASKYIQEDAKMANFHGTRRFTSEDNAEFKGTFKSHSKEYPALDEEGLEYYLQNLKSEKIGDADYDMSKPESLADFIKWSKKKYPNAKRNILILSGHGGGWTANLDGATTRAMLFDDNVDDNAINAQGVIDAIAAGDGIDMLYIDACLMSMFENLYTYARGVKYLLASNEPTPGKGGDYRMLLNLLKTTDTTEANFEEAMHKYVDYSCSDKWWLDMKEPGFFDLGFFNLSKLSVVTPILKKVSDTLAQKFTSDESIQSPIPDLPYGDQFAPYIRQAFMQTLIAYRKSHIELANIPEALQPYLQEDETTEMMQFEGLDTYVYSSFELIDWLRNAKTDIAKQAHADCPEAWKALKQYLISITQISYSLPTILLNLNGDLKEINAANNPFGELHDELIAALQQVAHIACTKPSGEIPGINQEYDLCSPGIYIVPMNKYYKSEYNPLAYTYPTFEEALNAYQNSDFDKAVGWSNVLKVIDVCPSLFFNPTRQDTTPPPAPEGME